MKLPEFLTQDNDGFIHVTGHRVGLEHLVYYWREGYSPEMLSVEYPSLSLADIYKVIAFYFDNRDFVDAYVEKSQATLDGLQAIVQPAPSLAELRQRIETASTKNPS